MKKTVLVLTLAAFVFAACATPAKNTAIGAGVGALGGAAAGAVIAKTTGGNAAQGAVWGAAGGLVLGGAIGNYFDKQAAELAKIADVKKTENGLEITLKSDILFNTGSSELSADAKTNLAALGKVLKKYPYNIIVVEGNTDSTGTLATNLSLSERRAATVQQELLKNNVQTYSLTAKGNGPNNPVATNSTADGRQANRRVDLKITANKELVEKNYKG